MLYLDRLCIRDCRTVYIEDIIKRHPDSQHRADLCKRNLILRFGSPRVEAIGESVRKQHPAQYELHEYRQVQDNYKNIKMIYGFTPKCSAT